MAAYLGPDDRWRYRTRVQIAGKSVRVSGTAPKKQNTQAAAVGEERAHIARLLNPATSTITARKDVPTFEKFGKEFLSGYAKANNKPSEYASKERNIRTHLGAHFGTMRLDDISVRDVEAYKAAKLAEDKLDKKTINNTLMHLSKILRYACELEVITKVPRIRQLKVEPSKFDFLEFDELAALIKAAGEKADDFEAAVLIAADAGLRIGEIKALSWGDIDQRRGIITVRHNDWRGQIGTPKSGRDRKIPMTGRLAAALKAARHLKGDLVFSTSRGTRWKDNNAQRVMDGVCKRAQLRRITWHTLRHTFCSHLAMRGAPPRAIMELAGHAHITTTMRYMHLSPGAGRAAIALLEGHSWPNSGQISGAHSEASDSAS